MERAGSRKSGSTAPSPRRWESYAPGWPLECGLLRGSLVPTPTCGSGSTGGWRWASPIRAWSPRHDGGVVVADQPLAVGPLVDKGVAGVHLLLHTVLGQRERVEAGVDGVVPVEDRDDLLRDHGLRVAWQQVREVVDDLGPGGADLGGQRR